MVVPREDGFDITVASRLWRILFSYWYHDLKKRLGNIVVGYTFENLPVTAGDLNEMEH